MSIRLAFGTAGIRAALGPADDQMNARTVRAVAHALMSYLGETFQGARGRGICIGYDGRTGSALFAREFEEVARVHGFRVRAFAAPVPTPLLAFATRLHRAAAGVMITASHNPPHENGIKIYMEGGAQVLAPHDRAIAARIASYDEASVVDAKLAASAVRESLGETEVEAYLAAIERLVPVPSSAPVPPLAYSAMCGVGSALTRRVFARAGVHDVREVAAQAEPLEDFGGLTTPNPEHRVALEQLITHADSEGVALAFAHDPDADRLAVLVRDVEGSLRLLSGDEVGALLGSFLLEGCAARERALLVSTLVSGELLERVARAAGARFERTPTGFKWIASRARAIERSEGLHFLFGYEEAIGYAFGSMADDKDGVAALYVLLELARRLHAQGRSLLDELDALSTRHGVFATRQLTLPRVASDQPDILARLRSYDPMRLLGEDATAIDYRTREEAVDLLIVRTPDGRRLCARPSGTEPKLKLYLHARADVDGRGVAAARFEAECKLDELEAAVRSV